MDDLEAEVQAVANMPTGGRQSNVQASIKAQRELSAKYPQYDINRMIRVLGSTGDYRVRCKS